MWGARADASLLKPTDGFDRHMFIQGREAEDDESNDWWHYSSGRVYNTRLCTHVTELTILSRGCRHGLVVNASAAWAQVHAWLNAPRPGGVTVLDINYGRHDRLGVIYIY